MSKELQDLVSQLILDLIIWFVVEVEDDDADNSLIELQGEMLQESLEDMTCLARAEFPVAVWLFGAVLDAVLRVESEGNLTCRLSSFLLAAFMGNLVAWVGRLPERSLGNLEILCFVMDKSTEEDLDDFEGFGNTRRLPLLSCALNESAPALAPILDMSFSPFLPPWVALTEFLFSVAVEMDLPLLINLVALAVVVIESLFSVAVNMDFPVLIIPVTFVVVVVEFPVLAAGFMICESCFIAFIGTCG